MIQYTRANSAADLAGILSLQRKNLPSALTAEEAASQGFLTVVHSLQDLQKMNDIEQHVIAKENDEVIAYLLAMTIQSKNDIPLLKPMFALFENLSLHNKKLSYYRYLVVGQVCVDKAYRGRGVFDACYRFYKECFREKYAFAITEIDAANHRSLAAHKRVGFTELNRFAAPDGRSWVVVFWDWNTAAGRP